MLANGKTTKPAGLTKDTGYQFGLRKTFDIKIGQAWHFLTSQEGIHLWLGDVPDFRLEKGFAYRTPDGATGEVRVVNVEVNFRLTWQPGNWPKASTIQIRVIPIGNRTTISFHQENLPDAEAREQMRLRWGNVMAVLENSIHNWNK